jgi:hypothetical protein
MRTELEEDAFVALYFPPTFSFPDVEAIGARLVETGALVPGYVPPEAGLLSIQALRYAHVFEEAETRLLVDRNLVSRMARLARDGVPSDVDGPTRLALDLMAFAQAMDLQIDPSFAFHELAFCEGNDVAHEELSWFRAADDNQHEAWVEMAQGRLDRLPLAALKPQPFHDLAFPLKRWRRNYVVALKIAELELAPMKPVERALALFRWMIDDYFLAGPAAIFATMYFAPFAQKRRLIKSLRSPNRDRAIGGIKNAAWDITHLSNFVEQRKRSQSEPIFFIFATGDRGLAEIAPVLMVDADEHEYVGCLAERLSAWWPTRDAEAIATALFAYIGIASKRTPPGTGMTGDPIGDMISAGEARLREWRPE